MKKLRELCGKIKEMNTIIENIALWTTAQTPKTSGRGNRADNQQLLGIQKLRELILELAVRGKLTQAFRERHPELVSGSNSASVLLKKIEAEKKRLIKEGKIKKQEVLSEIGEDEKPFDLPEGWEWTKLANLSANIHYGYTASANQNISDIRLLRITDIQNDKVDWETVPGCEINEDDIPKYVLENGDILIARTGGTIGKSYLVERINVKSVFASYLIRVQRVNGMFPEFIKVFLGSQLYWTQLYANSMGTGQPNVNGVALSNLVFALPPLAEQHRVVAKVDELMALCDQLEQQQTENNQLHQTLVETLLANLTQANNLAEQEEAWQRIDNNFDTLFTTEYSIDQLKQTILQLAVMGKLVPQDPTEEPASELLKKIAKEKARLVKEGKIKKQAPLPEITDDEKPFELREGWEWTKLEDITQINPRNNAKDEILVSFIPMTLISTSHNGEHDQEERLWKDVKQGFTHFAEGDIGIAKITPCFENSKAVIFSNLKNGLGAGTTELHIARLFGKTLNQKYVLFYLKAPSFLQIGETKMTGTAGQKGLPKDFFAKNPFPLPPLAEQHRIVSKVDELFALCDALKERLAQAQTTQNLLAGAVVAQALATKPAGKVVYATHEEMNLAAEPE